MSPVGFTNRQLAKLSRSLDPAHVRTRREGDKVLAYVEGWFVVAEANRIFGYDGWDRQTVEIAQIFARRAGELTSCAYSARVRILVRAGEQTVRREGTGVGRATANDAAEAHERALKAAETDATKRALATFGGRFGLLLYGREPAGSVSASSAAQGTSLPEQSPGAPPTFTLHGLNGAGSAVKSPEAFCGGLRQLLAATTSVQDIDRLWALNAAAVAQLKALPTFLNGKGEHYADILRRLMDKTRKERESNADSPSKPASVRVFTPAPPYPLRAMAGRLGSASSDRMQVQSCQPLVNEKPFIQENLAPAAMASDAGEGDGNPKESGPVLIEALSPTRRSAISGGYSIDKSRLALPSERRLRSKAHLARLAALPCVVCEALPCHAHHLTFAQPRGLSQKVSDEFTVPLCVEHHNALHANHNEAAWWRVQGIEPLPIALRLWRETAEQQFEQGTGR